MSAKMPFNTLRQLFSAYWQVALTYRGVLFIRGIHALMMPMVLMLVWLSVKRLPGSGFSDADYSLYYLLLPLIMTLTGTVTVHEIPEEIRDGTLNRNLLKPIHPIWYHIIKHVTFKAFTLMYLLPILLCLGWYIRDHLPATLPSMAQAVLFGLFLGFAVVLRFVMTTALAMTGFWLEHVETLHLILNQGIWAIFGGMVVPAETMPPVLRTITNLLPYRYSLSFPLEILRGHLSPSEILGGTAIGAGWCFLFLLITVILWRKGLREYTAYGG